MKNEVFVSNKIEKIKWNKIPSHRINSVTIKFNFSEEWKDLVCVALFIQDGKCIPQVIDENDECLLPVELKMGTAQLSVFGNKTDGSAYRETAIKMEFDIFDSGYCEDMTPPIPPTPDLYEQLLKRFADMVTVDVDQIYNALSENAQSGKAVAEAVQGGVEKANNYTDEKIANIPKPVLNHSDLIGREAPDQHTIGSITGLQDTLNAIGQGTLTDIESNQYSKLQSNVWYSNIGTKQWTINDFGMNDSIFIDQNDMFLKQEPYLIKLRVYPIQYSSPIFEVYEKIESKPFATWQLIHTSNVDQTYNALSENAQSGLAVAEAIAKAGGGASQEYVEQNFAPIIKDSQSGNFLFINDLSQYKQKITVNTNQPKIKVCGKNLFKYPYEETTKTVNGITFTDNGDGSITANGTASADAFFSVVSKPFVPTKTRAMSFMSGCPKGGGKDTFYIEQTNYGLKDYGEGVLMRGIAEYRGFRITIRQGYTANNLVFKPMLSYDLIDHTYEKPISWKEFDVVNGKTEIDTTEFSSYLTIDTDLPQGNESAELSAEWNADTKQWLLNELDKRTASTQALTLGG